MRPYHFRIICHTYIVIVPCLSVCLSPNCPLIQPCCQPTFFDDFHFQIPLPKFFLYLPPNNGPFPNWWKSSAPYLKLASINTGSSSSSTEKSHEISLKYGIWQCNFLTASNTFEYPRYFVSFKYKVRCWMLIYSSTVTSICPLSQSSVFISAAGYCSAGYIVYLCCLTSPS